jgi:putative ABC transport system substrate-binding protein
MDVFRSLRPKLRRIVALVGDVESASVTTRSTDPAVKAAVLVRDLVPVATFSDVERIMASLDPERELVIVPAPLPRGIDIEGIAQAAIRHRVVLGGAADAGGVVSVRLEHPDLPRQLAAILDKVLRGEKPAGIPFEVPNRSEITLNRATARRIGVEIAPELLLRATNVID